MVQECNDIPSSVPLAASCFLSMVEFRVSSQNLVSRHFFSLPKEGNEN